MRSEQLEIFLHIVDSGSISAAAEQMGLTQSTVSSSLIAIEREVGCSLVVRSRGQRTPLVPTREGSYFYEYAQDVLRLWEKFRVRISEAPRRERPVRLISGQTPAVTLLAGMLKSLHRKNGTIETSLLVGHVSTEEEVHRAMEETPFDFAFVTIGVSDPELICEPILEDPMILICNRSLNVEDEITLEEFLKLPVVLREEKCAMMISLEAMLHQHGLSIKDIRPAMTVYGTSAVREAVKYGALCGFVPRTAYRANEDAPHIRIVRVKGLENRRTVYLLRRRGAVMTPQMQLFRRFVLSGDWRSEFAL